MRSAVVLLAASLLFASRAQAADCVNENSAYGIEAHAPQGADLPRLLDEVKACGIGWIRIDFVWSWVEPSQNSFSWTVYDAMVAAAQSRGIAVYASIGNTPAWATSGAQGIGVPNNAADFYDVCYRAASRYQSSIRYWGMWNEPNLEQFWAGTRQQYIDIILKNGADAVHAGNPNAKVCGPELAHLTSGDADWYTWLPDCIAQAGTKLDVVTHHAYSGNYSGVTDKLEKAPVWPWDPPCVKDVLQSAGWLGKPFWLTETGWQSGEVGEAGQASSYTGLLTQWFTGQSGRDWVHKVFFYELNDTQAFSQYSFGILGQDTAYPRKQAFTAYQSFITAHPPAPAPPGKATVPSPSNYSTGISTNADLGWTAGCGALSHNVYLGTTSPGTFRGNQAAASFDPGTLAAATTYYWRIDEVSAGGTTTGDVWRFTTQIAPPGKATTPSPANLATGANRDVDLSWTAGGGATSHKVYFGTTSPGTFRVSQTGTSFDPGTLAAATTYYWRIDETNAGGTTTGDVWRFTTAAKPGDTDGDGDVDPADYSFFLLCCQGPGTPVSAGCAKVDFDADTDVDLIDFGVFQACFNGTGRSPACAD